MWNFVLCDCNRIADCVIKRPLRSFFCFKGGKNERKDHSISRRKKECKIRDLEKIVRPKSSKEFTEMVKSLNELEDEKLIYNDHTSLYLIDDIHFMAGSAKDISRYEIAVFNENNKVYVPKNKKMKIFDKDEVLVRLKPEPSLIKVFNHGLTNITGVMILKRRKHSSIAI